MDSFDRKQILAVIIWIISVSAGWVNAVRSEPAEIFAYQLQANGDSKAGAMKSDANRCQECHGKEGVSEDLRIPNHAAQLAGYLVKQLRDFQQGVRRHEVMNVMAEDLSFRDMEDIAAYFAGRPNPLPVLAVNHPGRRLFAEGDPGRKIQACAECHGESAQGRFAEGIYYPRLAGQKRVYLQSQLVKWKMAERANSPDGVMNKIAGALTDDELIALADFFSGR